MSEIALLIVFFIAFKDQNIVINALNEWEQKTLSNSDMDVIFEWNKTFIEDAIYHGSRLAEV